MRRIAHAHAGMSWKCRRVDVSWTQANDASDAPDNDDDDDDDDDSSTSPELDVTDRVIANFTSLVHHLHAWYFSDSTINYKIK